MTKKREGERASTEDFFDSIKESGIEKFVKAHPRFKNLKSYISQHVDQEKLYGRQVEIVKSKVFGNISQDERSEFLYRKLTDYIAEGGGLDDRAQRVLLKKE